MKVSDFQFELPDELIARYPQPERTASRLLYLNGTTGAIEHQQFKHIATHLKAGDLLVFNDTRVIPARLLGEKHSGGQAEVVVDAIIDTHRVLAHVGSNRAPKQGTVLMLEQAIEATMIARHVVLFELLFKSSEKALNQLEEYGHMPMPP